jgi:hypothetical protein
LQTVQANSYVLRSQQACMLFHSERDCRQTVPVCLQSISVRHSVQPPHSDMTQFLSHHWQQGPWANDCVLVLPIWRGRYSIQHCHSLCRSHMTAPPKFGKPQATHEQCWPWPGPGVHM